MMKITGRGLGGEGVTEGQLVAILWGDHGGPLNAMQGPGPSTLHRKVVLYYSSAQKVPLTFVHVQSQGSVQDVWT